MSNPGAQGASRAPDAPRGRVLVAGCGYVGTALAAELARAGHAVWGLRRRPGLLPEGVHPAAADLTDPRSLRALLAARDAPRELDAVVYTAAADARTEAAYRAAYVTGVECLVEALGAAGEAPRALLFTSSTSVYGQRAGEWVDERSATEPSGFTGRLVLEGERAVAASGWPAGVVRLGGIYGPGRTRLVERVRSCAARMPAHARYTNRIHRDDAAGILRWGIERALAGVAPEPVLAGVDAEPADEREVLRWLARELGVPEPPPEEAPPGPVPASAGKRVSSARLRALGYRLRVPTYREGYAPLVRAGGRVSEP